jgi:putative ABC transport system ATP-binding protein/lipoprotein-releasing system ATP-binding protein
MIAVEGLRFRYQASSDELFGGLDHAFAPGRLTVVTGRSGRGKSTLLYLLGLLLTPTEGSVRLLDRKMGPLSDSDRSRLRARHIGFVFQDAALDPNRTILDNVVEGGLYAGMSRRDAEARARSLMADLGVALPEGHRPGEVSGGQAQRIGLCRALLKDPSLILADEPTGNLDAESAAVVFGALAAAARSGATVIVATHDERVKERADDVLAL